jgi:hypothetical protein
VHLLVIIWKYKQKRTEHKTFLRANGILANRSSAVNRVILNETLESDPKEEVPTSTLEWRRHFLTTFPLCQIPPPSPTLKVCKNYSVIPLYNFGKLKNIGVCSGIGCSSDWAKLKDTPIESRTQPRWDIHADVSVTLVSYSGIPGSNFRPGDRRSSEIYVVFLSPGNWKVTNPVYIIHSSSVFTVVIWFDVV